MVQEDAGGLRLSLGEHRRWDTVQRILGGKLTGPKGAGILGLSERQVWRLVKRGRKEGAPGMIHRNRGRRSNRRTSEALRRRIVECYSQEYAGFNLTHFRERLRECEGVASPCRETLRKILSAAGVWERRRTAPKHRLRRPRREREGELLQMDASLHRWLGPDLPLIALVGAIDDATGDVPDAEFSEAETTEAYMKVFDQILRRRGVPGAVYTDKDSVFKVNHPKDREDARARGQEPLTQFGRALKELGVQWIEANSPQAKGRIERLWKTFQDRLLHEMGHAGIHTIPQANEYLHKNFLPRFNRQFRKRPACPDPAYGNKPLRSGREEALCWKESRVLARDHTFSYQSRLWQVLPTPGIMALAGRRIEDRTTLRGETQTWYEKRRLKLKILPVQPPSATLPAAARDFPRKARLLL